MKTGSKTPAPMLVPWYVIVMALVVFHAAMFFGLAHAFGTFDSILHSLPQCAMGALDILLRIGKTCIDEDVLYIFAYLAVMAFLVIIGPWLLYRTIRRSL